MIADRERRGEPGRFDAEEIYQSRHAVVPRPLDQEIARRLALRLDLGADAGVRRLEGAVLEMRPITAHSFVEDLRPLRIHVVIDALDPLDVRTEPRLAGKIEREVDSQSRGLGGGVHEAREGRAPGEAEVIALAVVARRDSPGRESGEAARDGRRKKAGAVDHRAGAQAHRFGAPDFELDAFLRDPSSQDRAAEGERRAAVLGLAAQGQHESVAVDDSGGRRLQRRNAHELRFHRAGLAGGEHAQVADAVGRAPCAYFFELADLRWLGGDDQLAAAPVGDAAPGAEGVERQAACHAKPTRGEKLLLVLNSES